MEKTAIYSGMTVLNYTILDNHFHLLLEIPMLNQRLELSEGQLLARIEILYGEETVVPLREALTDAAIGKMLALEHFSSEMLSRGVRLISKTEKARDWALRELERHRGLMNDLSVFMRLLKQRFSVWYNATHDRFGTLWSEKYRSMLVQETAECVRAVSAFVDLNAVRRGLVQKPEDYEFCGLGEAHRIPGMARDGLGRTMAIPPEVPEGATEPPPCEPPPKDWAESAERYRGLLWGNVSAPDKTTPPCCAADLLPIAEREAVLADAFVEQDGKFLRAAAMGGVDFVKQVFSNNRRDFGAGNAAHAEALLRQDGR